MFYRLKLLDIIFKIKVFFDYLFFYFRGIIVFNLIIYIYNLYLCIYNRGNIFFGLDSN